MVWTWILVLTLHFGGEKEWKGDAEITMKFTHEALCRSVRRAVWAQFKDADGLLGDCTKVVLPPQP